MSIAEKLQTIAENEQKVYDKGEERGHMQGFGEGYTNGYNQGYEVGKAEGGGDSGSYEDGFEDGKKAEYDDFWDNYQDFGKRTNYTRAFQGVGWTDITFRPKYDMAPTIDGGSGMLFGSQIIDLVSILNECGVVIDTSEMTNFSNMFQACSKNTTIPPLDLVKATVATNLLYNCSELKSITLNNVTEVCTFSGAFYRCTSLENITVTGTIGQNFDISAATKLSAASIKSIMDALSTTVSGMPTVTLSLVAVDREFETSEGANDGRYSDAWKELYFAHTDKWAVSLM